jgi:hypothetical protein
MYFHDRRLSKRLHDRGGSIFIIFQGRYTKIGTAIFVYYAYQ